MREHKAIVLPMVSMTKWAQEAGWVWAENVYEEKNSRCGNVERAVEELVYEKMRKGKI